MTTQSELLELANEAYRKGEPIMGDTEYDELEKELNLENINTIGEKHSPELTIKHPYIMGSLSKIQVHEDKTTHTVDWENILNAIKSYTSENQVIITPKFDGCSFEVYVKNSNIVSISTRGDGVWGKDISHILTPLIHQINIADIPYSEFTLRGEVLIRKSIFDKKYAESFTNTRSFVAGILGRDSVSEEEINDLSLVVYDYRVCEDGVWKDLEFDHLNFKDLKNVHLPEYYIYTYLDIIEDIYNDFDVYRQNSDYSLDGFVIKPVEESRLLNLENPRPKDCVAIKFKPATAETEATDIIWELGKTGEYTPVVYYKTIIMDGKECVKASGHNYGWLLERGVAVGAKIVISMAGDIIPYIYRIIESVDNVEMTKKLRIPGDAYIDGCHLMKRMTDEEKRIEEFRNSCSTLDVPGLGDAQIQKLIDELKIDCEGDEFFMIEKKDFPISIFCISDAFIARAIGGKNGEKIAKSFKEILNNIQLSTIIESMNFRFCGSKLSAEVAKYFCGGQPNFESKASEGYNWIYDKESENYKKLMIVLNYIGKTFDDFKYVAPDNKNEDGIPIIMTGEPNDYETKAAFLKAHPEYVETTSWKQVKIVFTNSLDSNTGKMKKAREKGIPLQLY